ncbi:reverse transcriptase [Penicillium viridicatum]|nr:reverse transcriptase [Penicillium viridicatum]
MDGHSHPGRNQPTPQEYNTVQEMQKIPPFAVVLSSRRAEEYRDRDHQLICISLIGRTRVDPSDTDRNGRSYADCGFGGVIQSKYLKTFFILGARAEQNLYSGKLVAIAHALSTLPGHKQYRISLLTSNKAVAPTLRNPRQRSDQEHYKDLLDNVGRHAKQVVTALLGNTLGSYYGMKRAY